MQYHNSYKKNSTITTKVMCAIVFWLFSLAWLFWFQADLLTIAQHVLSKGQTHYDRTVGALLITFVLYLVQIVVHGVVKLNKRSHALTYLPSMLLLAMISDINPVVLTTASFWKWLWLVPVVLVLWGVFIMIAKQTLPFDSSKERTGLFSRRLWVNMLFMIGMIVLVVTLSNTNAVYHYRAHIEVSICKGDYAEALRTGNRSLESDESLTMLRAYALSHEGLLGERLFEYPVVGTSKTLLPMWNHQSAAYLIPVDSFYHHFGARPVAIASASRYFELLERDSLARQSVADYRLCGLLVDKRIDEFARELPHYYAIDETLPKHYREAATLYMHLRSNPVLIFSHEVSAEDWKNFQELERTHANKAERKQKVAERYQHSYWYYYFYK